MTEDQNIYKDEYNKHFITLLDYKIKRDDKALYEDAELNRVVTEDICTIISRLPHHDVYEEQFPIVQVVRDDNYIRVYGLEPGGGIAIHYKKQIMVMTIWF